MAEGTEHAEPLANRLLTLDGEYARVKWVAATSNSRGLGWGLGVVQ